MNKGWGFNYTLANEDSSLEVGIATKGCKHIASVAGSGARIVPLLAKHPQRLTCIDSSYDQLLLTKLRIEAIKKLCREEYMAFMGYPCQSITPAERKALFTDIAHKEPELKKLAPYFEKSNWSGLIYLGKWEKALSKMAKLVSPLKLDPFLHIENLEDWQALMKDPIIRLRWRIFMRLIGSSMCLRALFYSGRLPPISNAKSYFDFFSTRFEYLATQHGFKNSFFAQLLLSGQVNSWAALPIEVDEDLYGQIKEGANLADIHYVNETINEFSEHNKEEISCVSLSDVPSYLDPKTYTRLLMLLRQYLSADGTIISRYFAYRPNFDLPENTQSVTTQFEKLIQAEKTQFYDIEIFQPC